MSPIFVRPVREQLEHDRLIRHLHAKYKRKFEVAVNPGEEQVAPVKIGTNTFFPDLVLTTDGKKLAGLVEVESAESVNNLEAMAQWVHFARARVPFHLYVPVQGYDAARRLCEANHARVSEVWTYRPAADGFDLVRVFADAGATTAKRPSLPVPEPKSVEPDSTEPRPEPRKSSAVKAEKGPRTTKPVTAAKSTKPAGGAAAKKTKAAAKRPAPAPATARKKVASKVGKSGAARKSKR